MARVAALIPDLLFASKVQAMLEAAGHTVELLAPGVPAAPAAADVVLVDLVSAGSDGLGIAAALPPQAGRPRTLATYSHVDAEARRRALDAGFDLVVPRSRMVREGAELVGRLTAAT